jgi:poly(3-hydroxybutyrate) depolymerase
MVLLLAVSLLAGCAVPQPQNTPVSQLHEVNPVTGTGYYIYVPSTYRHDRPAPVVVSCHGTPPFDVAEHHVREWKMLGEQNGCIIITPELVGTDGILGDGPRVAMLENERRIVSILCQVGYRYNIDLANMMITGFSGGGFPTYWVGLRNPELFSAVVGRSCNFSESNFEGWYPPEAKQTAVLVYYGSNDPGTISSQSRNAIRYFHANGFNVSTTVIPGIGHERRPEVAMAFFRRNMNPPKPSMPLVH